MKREYGKAELIIDKKADIFSGYTEKDRCLDEPRRQDRTLSISFRACSAYGQLAGCSHGRQGKKFYALQFHPEVVHTPLGTKILGTLSSRYADASPSGR